MDSIAVRVRPRRDALSGAEVEFVVNGRPLREWSSRHPDLRQWIGASEETLPPSQHFLGGPDAWPTHSGGRMHDEDDWRGWWGDEPPYHAPVFVLTHHPRESIEMAGGTTFHFVSDGFDAALERAKDAAGEMDVDIAGGASTVRQALAAGAIDDLYLDVVPVLLGGGESIFDGVPDPGFTPVEVTPSPHATHVRYSLG